MKNKAVSGTMVTLLLMGVLSASFVIKETSASPTVRIYVDMPLGYIPGVPPGPPPSGFVFVDLYIDTDIIDNTPQGLIQWAISVKVDPTVLEPMSVQGAQHGYFFHDFLVRYGYNFMAYATHLMPPIIDKDAGIMKWICEAIVGKPAIPKGAGAVPGQMPYKLCTLVFNSLSETGYSPVDLYYEVGVDAWYWTVESGWEGITVDVVEDGHYNLPENAYMFETLAGGTFPIGDPTGTDWHEIEPIYCQNWTLESWIDGGDGLLSPSDEIAMFRIEPPQPGPDPTWFHVEWVNPAPIAGDGIPDLLVTEISPGIPPLASFTFSPPEPVRGETLTFDASASYDPDGEIVSYAWDFGDGTFGSSVIVHHAYVSEGDWHVTLTVTDNDGLTSTAADVITVSHTRAAVLSVCPSTSTVLIGETFTINLTITDVSNLYGWQARLFFDPDFLQVDNVAEGPFLAATGEITDFMTTIDNTAGYIIVFGLFMPPFPEYGATGDGVLATIAFSATSCGTTTLEFDKDDLYTYLREVIWDDYHATPPIGHKVAIPCELVDAYVSTTYCLEYTALNATYHALLANYSNLQDEFDSLNSSYCELENSYDGLNSTYYDLLGMHSQLQSDYDDLESKHDTLTGDLSTTRNLSYALIMTTIVFIATTVYLATRKPKRKTELKSI